MSSPTSSGPDLALRHLQTNRVLPLPTAPRPLLLGKPQGSRSPDLDLTQFPHAEIVSRRHAEIRWEGDRYWLVDLGSANGTFVNQLKLTPGQPCPLQIGDQIDLGQGAHVTFIVQEPAPQAAAGLLTRLQATVSASAQTTTEAVPKIFGLALMVAGIVFLASRVRLGLYVSLPGVLLCGLGIVLLCQPRTYRPWGWLAIAGGLGIMVFSGGMFASVNLLTVLVAGGLILLGQQLASGRLKLW